MNDCTFYGRFVADPELTYTPNGVAICNFKLAVDRKVKKEGEPDADFPKFKAFGKTAEHIANYCKKGFREIVIAHYQNGSYEKDGQKVFTHEFIVDRIEMIDWPEK
jgi:single-strand DNA-binding protein